MDEGAVVAVAALEEERASRCIPPLHQPHRLNFVLYVKHVSKNFGAKFTCLLACNYFFLKGIVYVFIQGVQLPYFKHLGVDGVQYQTFNVIALTPWAMKGFIGSRCHPFCIIFVSAAISDSFALGGYHKR